MGKNPKWTRDELILALELYLRVNPIHVSEKHPEIIELSEFLNKLPIHPLNQQIDRFRNTNGVYMKLCNFLRFDPSYTGKGLERGGQLEKEIWDEYADDKNRLINTVKAIRNAASIIPPPKDEIELETEELFNEGRILTQLHIRRERNQKVVKRKKETVLNMTGALKCEVCSFNFYAVYGELGYGFAECHHITPLSSLDSEGKTTISELAIVCANCHRMLHRSRPLLSIYQLKTTINAK